MAVKRGKNLPFGTSVSVSLQSLTIPRLKLNKNKAMIKNSVVELECIQTIGHYGKT